MKTGRDKLASRMTIRIHRALLGIVVAAAMISSASAATYYWDVNGTTAGFSTVVGAWNTATYWNTDSLGGAGTLIVNPTDADDLIIPQATINTGSITVTGTKNGSSITFAASVGPTVTITGGGPITIGGSGGASGIFQQSSGANTISTALTLNSAITAFNFSNSSSGLLTIGTGTTTGGASATQTITVGSSSDGGIAFNNLISNGAGGTVALNINSSGSGVTTLGGNYNRTFSGGVTLTAGTLSANGNAGALGAGTLTLNGGILDFNHSGSVNFARNTTVGGNVIIISEKNTAGAGVTYTLGTLAIGGNTLTVQGGNVNSGTAGLTFGATTLSGATIFDVANPVGGGGTTLTLGAVTGDAYNFTKNGTGALNLSAAGTGSGTYTVSGGVLRLSNATALPGGYTVGLGTSALTLNGGVLELASSTFTRNLGTGVTEFQITGGESGFSAVSAARIVTVNNSAATEIEWGSASFAPTTFVLNAATANNTILFSNNLDLNNAVRTVTVLANTATMSGVIRTSSGTAGLTKTGAGTLVLSNAANTYNGGTTVSVGTLRLDAAGALPSGGNVVLNGGTLYNNGAITQTAGSLTLTANSTIVLLASSNPIYGGGSLIFSGAVGDWSGLSLTLSGPLTPTSLRFGTDSTGLSAAQLARITNTLLSGAIKTVTINGSGYVTSGSTDGLKQPSGNWSDPNNWSSSIIASGEDATCNLYTLSANRTHTVDQSFTIGHLQKSGNKYHTVDSSGGSILTFAVSSGMPTIQSSTESLTITATLGGNDGLEIITGTIILYGDNIYTGGTQLTAGTLSIGHDNALGGALSGTIALNGGTIQSNDGTARSFGNAVTIGGDFTVGGTGNMTFSNTGDIALGAGRIITVTTADVRATFAQVFSGNFNISKAGAGTLVLTGLSTRDSVTAISGGKLEVSTIGNVLGGASPFGNSTGAVVNRPLGSGTTTTGSIWFTGTGASLVYTGTGETTDRPLGSVNVVNWSIDQSGSGLLKFTGTLALNYPGGANYPLTLQGSTDGTGEISINMGDSSAGRLHRVIKAGTGTWTLSGANTYTGGTTVNAGTLALGAAGALPAAGNVILAGGTLDIGTVDNAAGTPTRTLTLSGNSTIALGTGQLAFADSSAAIWSGALTLTGTLGATSLRFGTDASGLTEAQLLLITCNGQSVVLNPAGYVILAPSGGTLFLFE